jgi:AraC-like DNA-binding protein
MEPALDTSHYCEYAPPGRLARSVVCFWTQTVAVGATHHQQVLPDCCVDLVITNGKPTIIGPWIEPFVASLPAGTQIVAVRLQPGFASALGIPAADLLNGSASAAELWGSAVERSFQRVADASGTASQLSALEHVLTEHQINSADMDPVIGSAIKTIAADPTLQIDELSHELSISKRQLQRRFVASVGYGPKLFQSVLRFQRLLKLSSSGGVQGNLARFAVEAGYTDQSHMSREVQRFSGKTPKTLLGQAGCALGWSNLLRETGNPNIL